MCIYKTGAKFIVQSISYKLKFDRIVYSIGSIVSVPVTVKSKQVVITHR